VRSTAAPYTESRLTRSVANERVGFPVVEQYCMTLAKLSSKIEIYLMAKNENICSKMGK
jgi:hypothetical protein